MVRNLVILSLISIILVIFYTRDYANKHNFVELCIVYTGEDLDGMTPQSDNGTAMVINDNAKYLELSNRFKEQGYKVNFPVVDFLNRTVLGKYEYGCGFIKIYREVIRDDAKKEIKFNQTFSHMIASTCMVSGWWSFISIPKVPHGYQVYFNPNPRTKVRILSNQ